MFLHRARQASPLRIAPTRFRLRPPRQPLLLVTLLLLLHVLHPPTAVSARTLCDTPECNSCAAACPSFSVLTSEYSDCSHKLLVARSEYVSAATDVCRALPCYPILLTDLCSLIPQRGRGRHYNPHRSQDALLRQLDTLIAKADRAAERYVRRTAQVRTAMARDAPVSEYAAHVETALLQMRLIFDDALRMRARTHQQHDYMNGAVYRDLRTRVRRLRLEDAEWRRQLSFWRGMHGSVSRGVRSSPRTLAHIRDRLLAERRSHQDEGRLLGALRKGALTKDDRAHVVLKLKQDVRGKIDEVKSFVALLNGEKAFLREAQKEIFLLLQQVSMRVRRRASAVKCGNDAIADVVTSEIMRARH